MRTVRWGLELNLDKLTVGQVEEMREEDRRKPEPTGNWFLDHIVRGLR